ncbi:FtsX-like permease family protein, partial [Streptomyces boncukensis]
MIGFVLLRVRAHRLLVAAALLTVVLATSVLATLSAFSSAIGEAGVRRALTHQSASRAVVDIHADVTAADRQRTDAAVRKAARRSFDGLPVRVAAATSSGSYALPGALRPADAARTDQPDQPDLTRFASVDPDRVRLTAGTWPRAPRADGAVPAAIPRAAADRLRLKPGDTFRVTSRLDGPPPVRVRITGVYRPASPGSPYWRLDPLRGEGVRTVDYTTYGPLAVPDAAFARQDGRRAAGLPVPAESRWQARADFSGLAVSRIGALRDHVERSVAAVGRSPGTDRATASSDLPQLLDTLDRALLVTRSTLLIAALQLILLTGLALLLVAQLLAAERAEETSLLRARGASRTRIRALSALEALLLALPAALVAPLLAGPAVRQLTGYGALARAGVEPTVRLPAGTWWAAAAAALGCAAVLVLPALRRHGEAVGAPQGRGTARRPERPGRVRRFALRGGCPCPPAAECECECGGHAPRSPAGARRALRPGGLRPGARPARRAWGSRAGKRGPAAGHGRPAGHARGSAALLRGGADLALVALAALAYWQLERRSEGTGVLSGGAGDGAADGVG